MKRIQLVLIVAGIAALAVGGTALASKGGAHSPRAAGAAHDHRRGHDSLAAAASYLGISTESLLARLHDGTTLAQVADATSGKSAAGLVDALVAHEKDELAAAVAAGRLTQAQSEQVAAMLEQRITSFVNGVRPPFPGRPHGDGLSVAAGYLGTTVDSLLAQLRAGKTLAQIANATSGKSANGLVDALVADAVERFGMHAPADLRRRITELVNGSLPALGPRGHHDHWLPPPRRSA